MATEAVAEWMPFRSGISPHLFATAGQIVAGTSVFYRALFQAGYITAENLLNPEMVAGRQANLKISPDNVSSTLKMLLLSRDLITERIGGPGVWSPTLPLPYSFSSIPEAPTEEEFVSLRRFCGPAIIREANFPTVQAEFLLLKSSGGVYYQNRASDVYVVGAKPRFIGYSDEQSHKLATFAVIGEEESLPVDEKDDTAWALAFRNGVLIQGLLDASLKRRLLDQKLFSNEAATFEYQKTGSMVNSRQALIAALFDLVPQTAHVIESERLAKLRLFWR